MEFENFVSEQSKKYESQPHLISFINLLYFQFTKGILCSYDLKKYITQYEFSVSTSSHDTVAQTMQFAKSKVIHGGKLKVDKVVELSKVKTTKLQPTANHDPEFNSVGVYDKTSHHKKTQSHITDDVYTIIESAKTKLAKLYIPMLQKNDKLHEALIAFVTKHINISKFDTPDKKANFASILKNRIIMNTYMSEKFCIDLLHFDLDTQKFNNNKHKPQNDEELMQLIDLIDKYQPDLYTYYINYATTL